MTDDLIQRVIQSVQNVVAKAVADIGSQLPAVSSRI